MKFNLRIPFLFLLLFLFSTPCIYGQLHKPATDSTFEDYMENAWDNIRQSDRSDSLQTVYSEEFYQYYLANPGAKTANKALSSAFFMWANIGDAEKADKAMAQIDYDSAVWHDFIPYVGNAYARSSQKTNRNYITLLTELREKLTHPMSRSQALWMMSGYFQDKHQTEELIKVAREMIELDADEFFVDQGLGYLYEIESLSIGQKAPDFTAETLQGHTLALADASDKIILLDFWATWCGPCLPEIPHLKKLQSKYTQKGLQIIGISLDEDPEKLKTFIRERELLWPQIIQPNKWKDEIVQQYNINGIPRTYIIGRDGTIVAKDLRGEELEKEIARLMHK